MAGLKKALFLDRDGVLNRERGEYTFRVNDFEILPTVISTLKKAQESGYLLIVITNQGGIAKGLYTHQDVKLVHDYFTFTLEEAGVLIDDIFYSPHHQDFSKSLDRKPGSLMFEKAIAMHGIDPLKSFMIGDSARDIIACEATKVSGFLIEPNSNLNFILNYL